MTYGPNLQAWCVYLMTVHAIPVHRCAELIASLAGAAPLGRVRPRPARPRRRRGQDGEHADPVPGHRLPGGVLRRDPGPGRPGPAWRKRHLLVACTPQLTCYMLGDRTAASFAGFVLPDLTGTVIHDRYHVYDHPRLGTLTHQLCCAHLLRDLADAAETYPRSAWPAQLAGTLRALIHAANQARAAGHPAVPAPVLTPLTTAYRDAVTAALDDLDTLPRGLRKNYRHPCEQLLEDLRDREADVLRFTTDTRIPPTTNQAERDLRPAKTQEKISGRLRSETTTRHRYAIRGYLSTAAKHNLDPLTTLRNALTGTTWTPPIPAAL